MASRSDHEGRGAGAPRSDAAADDLRCTPWPDGGLERVASCPICESAERSPLHRQLWDNVFFAAPGIWSLWRCTSCGSAYLDPRPDAATIGLAYSRYYTHEEPERPEAETAYQKMRAALGNGYRNGRYGTSRRPTARIGDFLARLIPPLAWPVDVAFRYLPHRRSRPKGRAFDLGCGGGEWLEMAREAGWEVAGSDPDPLARARAAARGIEVRESIEAWDDQPESFDVVTMSHVIEHVHDPLATLASANRLLKPGGMLFVDTPNIEAIGHDRYGKDWRGLETPRHLVIFNRASLVEALRRSGFVNIRYRMRSQPFVGMSLASRRIAAGVDPYDERPRTNLAPAPGILDRIRAAISRRGAEFLTLTCEKRRSAHREPISS
jgi:2-polyprenyl-3-methyl-5-hydroxy-6-metoxy-1,4-benzoquinol methylase